MKSTIKQIYGGEIGTVQQSHASLPFLGPKVESEASSVEVISEPVFFNDNANTEQP